MRVGCSYEPQNPCHTLMPVELQQVLWYLKSMHYTHISLPDVRLHNCPSYFIWIQKRRWQWHKCWIYRLHSQCTLNSFFFFLVLFSHSVGGEKEKRSRPVSSESYSNQWRTQNIVLHYSTADERMCLIAKPSLFNILTFILSCWLTALLWFSQQFRQDHLKLRLLCGASGLARISTAISPRISIFIFQLSFLCGFHRAHRHLVFNLYNHLHNLCNSMHFTYHNCSFCCVLCLK